MPPSSTSSWPGGCGADIIDLDRYMRGNVRPSRTLSEDSKYERLVVDCGGASLKASHESGDARLKRHSHDSGVSDGSYRPRRHHRAHRRNSYQDGVSRPPHESTLPKTLGGRANSSSSLRAFRTVCEQALLDQQRQIARVAELCERLTERAEKTEQNEKCGQNERIDKSARSGRFEKNFRNHRKVEQVLSEETSEISSSSRSTKDPRRKDKYRTQECKTYKIIMNKLDDLNRMFSTRPPRTAQRPPRLSSSTSVSMCDKLVATEPQRTFNRVLAPSVQVKRAYTSASKNISTTPRVTPRAVTQAYTVDIAPRDMRITHANVLTESIVKGDSSSCASHPSAGDLHGFDLEDPVHLYSQAKRLQALNVSAQRARSVDPPLVAPVLCGEHVAERARSPSLCAVCRGYWRYLRQCVLPVFGGTADTCKCS